MVKFIVKQFSVFLIVYINLILDYRFLIFQFIFVQVFFESNLMQKAEFGTSIWKFYLYSNATRLKVQRFPNRWLVLFQNSKLNYLIV